MTVERAESLEVERIADVIESVGFECTDCGDCCTADDEPLAVTVFPDERRRLAEATDSSLEEVSEPSPFGGDETFEWTVRRDDCGDCFFHDDEDGGGCSAYDARPSVCRTYPFAVRFDDEGAEWAAQRTYDVGEATLAVGECEGTGREIDRREALKLAREVKKRAVKEEREARDLVDAYEDVEPPEGHVAVHDSEGTHFVEQK